MNPSTVNDSGSNSSGTPTTTTTTTNILNPLAVGQILSFSDYQTNKMVHVKIVPPLPPSGSPNIAVPPSLSLLNLPVAAEHNKKLVVNLNSTKIVIRNLNKETTPTTTITTPDSLLAAIGGTMGPQTQAVRQPRMLKSAANKEKAVNQLRKLNASTTMDSLDVVPMDLEDIDTSHTAADANGGSSSAAAAIIDATRMEAVEDDDDDDFSDAEIQQTVPQPQPQQQQLAETAQRPRTSTPKSTIREFKAKQKTLAFSKTLCSMVQSGAEGGARKARKSTPVLGKAASTSTTVVQADITIDDSNSKESSVRASPTVAAAPTAQSTPLTPTSSTSAEEKSRRQMRSQNAEFSAKQQRFLLGIQRDEQRDSAESGSEMMGSDSEDAPVVATGARSAALMVSTVADESSTTDNDRTGGDSAFELTAVNDKTDASAIDASCTSPVDAVDAAAAKDSSGTSTSSTLLRPESDPTCWLCHLPGATMPCVDCARSRHTNEHVCSRVRLIPAGDRWRCAECVNELEAKRTAKAAKYTLDGLGPMLRFAIKRCMQIVGSKQFPFGPAGADDVAVHLANPMSFSVLRANVDAHRYTTTGAFTSDVKWFMHNCIVLGYKSNSRQVSIVRQILKTCKQEMYDIETCPECYYNANTHMESWFVEVCGQRPHILLWAKLKGFPYWPAKAMGLNATASAVDVRFFGEHDRAWVPIKDCFVFSEKEPNPPTKKLSRMNSFHDCLKEVDVYIEKIKQKFGQFTYAPERCAYEPEREDEQLELLIPNIRRYLATQRSLTYRIVKTANNSMSIIKSSADSPSPKQPIAGGSEQSASQSGSPSKAAADLVLTTAGCDVPLNMQPRVQLYSSDVARHGKAIAEEVAVEPKTTIAGSTNPAIPAEDMSTMEQDAVHAKMLKRNSTSDDAKRVSMKRVRSNADEMTTVNPDTPDVGHKAKKRHRARSLELESDGDKLVKAKHQSAANVSAEVAVENETIPTSVCAESAADPVTDAVDTSTKESTTNTNNEESIADKHSEQPIVPPKPPNPSALDQVLDPDHPTPTSTMATIPLSTPTPPLNPIAPISQSSSSATQSQTRSGCGGGGVVHVPMIEVVVKQEPADNDIDSMPVSSSRSSMNTSDSSLMVIKSEPYFDDPSEATSADADEDMDMYDEELSLNETDVLQAADSMTAAGLAGPQQQQQQKRGNITVKDLNELKNPAVLMGERRVGQSTTLRCIAKKDKSSRKYITTQRILPTHPSVQPVPPPGPRFSKIWSQLKQQQLQQQQHPYQQGMMTFNGRNMVYIPLPDDKQPFLRQNTQLHDLPIVAISRPQPTTTATITISCNIPATVSATTTTTTTTASKSTPPPLTSVSIGPALVQCPPSASFVAVTCSTHLASASTLQPLSVHSNTLTSSPPPLTLSSAGTHALMPPLLPPLSATTTPANVPPLMTTNPLPTAAKVTDNLPTQTSNITPADVDGGHMLSGFVSENLAAAVTDTIARGMPRLYAKPSGPLRSDGTTPFTSEAGPISQMLIQNSHKLADFFRSVIEDTLADMSGLVGTSSTAPQCPEARIKLLQLENERLRHAHATEIGQLRANTDRILCEMQKSMDGERQRIASDVRRQAEAERLRAVEETKRKQWCVQCGREAQFFCCWNTSYCDYPCQREHWVRHMPHCAQHTASAAAAPVAVIAGVVAPMQGKTHQNGTTGGVGGGVEKSQQQQLLLQQHSRTHGNAPSDANAKSASPAVAAGGKGASSAAPLKQQQQQHHQQQHSQGSTRPGAGAELVLAQRMGHPPSGLRIAQTVQPPRNSGAGSQRLNAPQSSSSNSSHWRGGAIISTAPPHFQLLNNRQVNCVMVSSAPPVVTTFASNPTTTTIASNNPHSNKSTAAPGTSLLLSPPASMVRMVTQPQPR